MQASIERQYSEFITLCSFVECPFSHLIHLVSKLLTCVQTHGAHLASALFAF